ncbi:unnamed protein product [Pleuronectes platessa]|uniref:Uncharacterized protein n=1 Tax=Pleuronectes platessa TaxID=8262 RepID=A0A9N7YPE7_PLEPL|nr:unnamed protein product [Pleuronectes platessa]
MASYRFGVTGLAFTAHLTVYLLSDCKHQGSRLGSEWIPHSNNSHPQRLASSGLQACYLAGRRLSTHHSCWATVATEVLILSLGSISDGDALMVAYLPQTLIVVRIVTALRRLSRQPNAPCPDQSCAVVPSHIAWAGPPPCNARPHIEMFTTHLPVPRHTLNTECLFDSPPWRPLKFGKYSFLFSKTCGVVGATAHSETCERS